MKKFSNSKNSLTAIGILSISLITTSTYAINGTLPMIRSELNLTQAQVETLVTVPSFALALLVLFSSLISTKIGERLTVNIGVGIIGLTGIIPFLTENYPLILISRVFLGAGIGMINSLAVSLIASSFKEKTAATLLGFRASIEQVGQAFLTFIAGLLMNISWQAPFLVYLITIPILLMFNLFVPKEHKKVGDDKNGKEIDSEQSLDKRENSKISPIVWLLAILMAILVADYIGMQVRFAQIATNIISKDYNASPFMSVMLIIAMIGGILFGRFYQLMKFKLIYFSLALFAISNFIVANSHKSLPVLIFGFILIGFPLQLISPLAFHLLPKLAPGNKQTFVTSVILIGFNVGVFVEPYLFIITDKIFGIRNNLSSIFNYFAWLFLIIACLIAVTHFFFSANKKRMTKHS
ncbi:MFS transporter [Oenococcus oeni]|uniref:MFS transporter n=1 Tax=Oenococcus oeni TaxID=1247 RepID=UPI0021B37574|nr:MFS transporter [Oenococcus oeni]